MNTSMEWNYGCIVTNDHRSYTYLQWNAFVLAPENVCFWAALASNPKTDIYLRWCSLRNLQSTVDIIPMVTNLSESLTQPFNHCMEYPLLFQTILYHPSLNQCVLLLALSERKVIPNADKLLARPYCVLKFICLILSGGTRAQCQHHHVNNLFD